MAPKPSGTLIPVTGLFETENQAIAQKTWYRQRFDACPHFMFFLGDAHISSIQQTPFPFGQRIAFAGFSKNRADWYHGLEELEYTAKHILALAKTDSHISQKMIQAFKTFEIQFYNECKQLSNQKLKQLNDQQLLEQYQKLATIYTKKLNSSPLIDGFSLTTDKLLASKIRTELPKNNSEKQFVEYFATLTAPTFLSFLQQEEIALLRITREIQKNPTKKTKLLEKHQQAFFWIQNNYVKDHILPVSFFEKRANAFLKSNCEAKIQEIEKIPIENAKKKKTLIEKLQLSPETQTLLKVTDDFNHWQDERKKGTFWATHYFSMLLEEMSKRSGYTLEELKYAFPTEMKEALERKLDAKILQKRFEYCMILWRPGRYDCITDLERIEKLDAIGTGNASRVKELAGFTASLGNAKGKARIIESVEEIHKVQEGDILIAVMTRPDYLPAMKKAAGFVTDEGGVTCHAAIVAREMGKPCVIATKIATKIIRDQDQVEVDADHGKVRILPRVQKKL